MKVWRLAGLLVLGLALVWFLGCGEAEKETETETEPEMTETEIMVTDYTPTEEELGTEVTCAICGMKMELTAEMPVVMYDGQKYYFCNAEEKAEFVAAPEKFVGEAEKAMEEAGEEAEAKVKEATGQ